MYRFFLLLLLFFSISDINIFAQQRIIPTWTTPYYGYGARYNYAGTKMVTFGGKGASIWDANSHTLVVNLIGHTDMVRDAKFSRNGERLVTVSDDGTAIVWNTGTGGLVNILYAKGAKINKVDINAAGTSVATCDVTGKTLLWEANTGKRIKILKDGYHEDGAAVRYNNSGDVLLVVSTTMELFDVNTGNLVKGFYEPGIQNHAAEFNLTDDRILSVNTKQASLWNVKTGTLIRTFNGHKNKVYSAQFNAKGDRVVTAGSDNTRIWDAKTGDELFSLNGHNGEVLTSVYGSNDSLIVTATKKEVKIWDANTGEILNMFEQSAKDNIQLSFHPDNQRIVISNQNGSSEVWDCVYDKLLHRFYTCVLSDVSLKINKQNNMIVTTCPYAFVWDMEKGNLLHTFQDTAQLIVTADFNDDATELITGGTKGNVTVWGIESEKKKYTLKEEHATTVLYNKNLIFSFDKYYKVAKIYEAGFGGLIDTFKCRNPDLNDMYLNTTGDRLIIYENDIGNNIDGYASEIWNVNTGKFFKISEFPKLSSDNKRILSGFDYIYEHDLQTGDELKRTETNNLLKNEYNQPYSIYRYVLNEENNKVVVSWSYGPVTIHDFNNWSLEKTIIEKNLKFPITRLYGNKNGRYVVIVSDTIRLWDMKTYTVIATLENYDGYSPGGNGDFPEVNSIVFSQDDKFCVGITGKGVVKLWDLRGVITSSADENFSVSKEKIQIVPNPACSSINITTPLVFDENSSYQIVNLLGEKIVSGIIQSENNLLVSTEKLEQGMYLIYINNKGKVWSEKFTVNK